MNTPPLVSPLGSKTEKEMLSGNLYSLLLLNWDIWKWGFAPKNTINKLTYPLSAAQVNSLQHDEKAGGNRGG